MKWVQSKQQIRDEVLCGSPPAQDPVARALNGDQFSCNERTGQWEQRLNGVISMPGTGAGRLPQLGQSAGKALQTCLTLLTYIAGELTQTDAQTDVQTKSRNNKPSRIYRSASGTPDSLTPRPGIDDVPGGGLSFFDNLSNPGVKPGKYVEVDTAKLVSLLVIPDNDPPGHVTVTPASPGELQTWAATRGTGQIHPYTAEIMATITFIGKK